jgi:biotin operon repressor
LSRSVRLLALLQALRRRRRPVTAAALARELQVSERTIYRDLSELAGQGAPVQGEAGVGYILRPGLFLPPAHAHERRNGSRPARVTLCRPARRRRPHQSRGKCPCQDPSGPTPGRADCRDFADGHSRSEGQSMCSSRMVHPRCSTRIRMSAWRSCDSRVPSTILWKTADCRNDCLRARPPRKGPAEADSRSGWRQAHRIDSEVNKSRRVVAPKNGSIAVKRMRRFIGAHWRPIRTVTGRPQS